jgi:hypothetical protein
MLSPIPSLPMCVRDLDRGNTGFIQFNDFCKYLSEEVDQYTGPPLAPIVTSTNPVCEWHLSVFEAIVYCAKISPVLWVVCFTGVLTIGAELASRTRLNVMSHCVASQNIYSLCIRCLRSLCTLIPLRETIAAASAYLFAVDRRAVKAFSTVFFKVSVQLISVIMVHKYYKQAAICLTLVARKNSPCAYAAPQHALIPN